MKYECKECKTKFDKNLGQAKCPQCGSKDLWIIGGATNAILIILAAGLIMFLVSLLVSIQMALGAFIALVVMIPIIMWSILKQRKNPEDIEVKEDWKCPKCNKVNPYNKYTCEVCGFNII